MQCSILADCGQYTLIGKHACANRYKCSAGCVRHLKADLGHCTFFRKCFRGTQVEGVKLTRFAAQGIKRLAQYQWSIVRHRFSSWPAICGILWWAGWIGDAVDPDLQRINLQQRIRTFDLSGVGTYPTAVDVSNLLWLDAAFILFKDERIALLCFGEFESLPIRFFTFFCLAPILPFDSGLQCTRANHINRGLRLDVQQVHMTEVQRVLLSIAGDAVEWSKRDYFTNDRIRWNLQIQTRLDRDNAVVDICNPVLLASRFNDHVDNEACLRIQLKLVRTRRGKTLQLPLRRQLLKWFQITQTWRWQVERVLICIDTNHDIESTRNDAHIFFCFEYDGRSTGICLHSHGRRSENGLLRAIRQLKNNGHARRPRGFPSHGQPIEKTATHFLARAIEAFGNF